MQQWDSLLGRDLQHHSTIVAGELGQRNALALLIETTALAARIEAAAHVDRGPVAVFASRARKPAVEDQESRTLTDRRNGRAHLRPEVLEKTTS